MKKVIISTVFLVINSFSFAQKIELNAKVDERCELISTVFRLAEAEEYMDNEFPVFVDSVVKYFEPYKNHELIEYAKMFREKYYVGYDAPMSLAVHLQIVDGKISLIPNVKENSLDSRWNRDRLPRFIELLNDFYTTTKFHDFFQRQTIKEKVETAATEYFKKIDMEWFKNFFGEVPEGGLNLIITLSNGWNNYGPKVEYPDNKADLYSIIYCEMDSLNNPFFEDDWAIDLIIHEYSHSFCNHLITENYPKMRKKANEFYAINQEILRNNAYGNSYIMLCEILVRASVIKYFMTHFPENKLIKYFKQERYNGFMWIEELYDALNVYEQNREKYPTLRSFMPEIVKVQNELNPKKMEKERKEEQQKNGATMSIANIVNGDQNVDASITQIIVKFDRPMLWICGSTSGKKGEKYSPKQLGAKWNEEKTEWILEVKLEPNKEYSIAFPAHWFMDEDYVFAKNTVYLDFKTK